MKFALIASLLLAATLGACKNENATVLLQAKVLDENGRPIAGASCTIEGQDVGVSDANGLLQATLSLARGARYSIRINKKSAVAYYSEFKKRLSIPDAPNFNPVVRAVLYSVQVPPLSLPSPTPVADSAAMTAEAVPAPTAVEAAINPSPVPETLEVPAGEEEKPVSLEPMLPDLLAPNEANTPASRAVTFHAFDENNALQDVTVYLGNERAARLKILCVTATNGRCFAILAPAQARAAIIYARKNGYGTRRIVLNASQRDHVRLQLSPAKTLEVLALTSHFAKTSGVEGVEVRLDQRLLGKTDRFGHFSMPLAHTTGDAPRLSLVAKNALPNQVTGNVLTENSTQFSAYFYSQALAKPQVLLLKMQFAGKPPGPLEFGASPDAFRQAVEASLLPFVRIAPGSGDLGGGEGRAENAVETDFQIAPTVINDERGLSLQLELLDVRGQVLGSVVGLIANPTAVHLAEEVTRLSLALKKYIPWEGVVSQRLENNFFTMTLAPEQRLTPGSRLTVLGRGSGDAEARIPIGSAEVVSAEPGSAVARLIESHPRVPIAIGNQAVSIPRAVLTPGPAQVVITTLTKSGVVPHVNVYGGEFWLGASDREGLLIISKEDLRNVTDLRFIKPGFRAVTRTIDVSTSRVQNIVMQRASMALTIDSVPPFALVKISGKTIGRTPVTHIAEVDSDRVKVELFGPSTHKPFAQEFLFNINGIEQAIQRTVILEFDYLGAGQRFIARGMISKAEELLRQVPESHSDYPATLNLLGELSIQQDEKSAVGLEFFRRAWAATKIQRTLDPDLPITIGFNLAFSAFINSELAADDANAESLYKEGLDVLDHVQAKTREAPNTDAHAMMERLLKAKTKSEERRTRLAAAHAAQATESF